MAEYRVLVTGSRDWNDVKTVHQALADLKIPVGRSPVLIHGACPTGADSMADQWARQQPNWIVRTYKAEWSKYGKAAGPIRNKQMVLTEKPEIVLAFCRNGSPGTTGTIALVKEHQPAITVIKYECDD